MIYYQVPSGEILDVAAGVYSSVVASVSGSGHTEVPGQSDSVTVEVSHREEDHPVLAPIGWMSQQQVHKDFDFSHDVADGHFFSEAVVICLFVAWFFRAGRDPPR